MKKQIILLITAVALSFSLNADNLNPIIVKIKKSAKENNIEIRLANLQKKSTQITIIDTGGKRWFFKKISKEVGYAEYYNLEGLPDNEYIVSVRNRNDLYFQVFSKEGSKLSFYRNRQDKDAKKLTASLTNINTNEVPGLITKITSKGDREIEVRLANLNKLPVTLRMFTHSGTVVQNERFDNKYGYAMKWNLQDITDGHYFLYIKTGADRIIQLIKLHKKEVKVGMAQSLNF